MKYKRLNVFWENVRMPQHLYWQAKDSLASEHGRQADPETFHSQETQGWNPLRNRHFCNLIRTTSCIYSVNGAGLSQYEMLCHNEVSYQFCYCYKTFVKWNQKGHFILHLWKALKISGVEFPGSQWNYSYLILVGIWSLQSFLCLTEVR